MWINTYQIADGYFISNFIGVKAFEAENLVFPALLIVMYVGLMFGTGASALIAKALGEGNKERARQIFSTAIYTLSVAGIVLSAALYFLLPSEILAIAVTIALLIWWRKKENSGSLPEADAEQGE